MRRVKWNILNTGGEGVEYFNAAVVKACLTLRGTPDVLVLH